MAPSADAIPDVMQTVVATPITVVATYEDGVHVLRWLEDDHMASDYAGLFTARLERTGGADG